MFKKSRFFSAFFILTLLLAACSSLSAAGTSPAPDAAGVSATTTAAASAAINSRLGIGILKLEGSDQAVTTEQANSLLFLWKGLKLLTSTKSSSTFELTALYQQIQETLTPSQVQAIQLVSWTQDEVAEFESLAASQPVFSQVSVKTSSSSSSGGDQGFGGPGGGGPSAEMALINGFSAPGSTTTTTGTKTAASAAKVPTTSSAAPDLNAQLADAVIALLQQRTGG